MRVRLSPRAREDLRGHIRHIATDSPRSARLVRDRINNAVQQLALHPESGRPGRVDGTRELVILHTSYIAPYRVTNGILEIFAFIHDSRQWPPEF
ncbi:MAG TPA: type II toxin-antitoxin system RelE/ParE family toxin [Chloroflexota bacterium]|nr:type II toxin-antitoxin system RelE/ParE family toxin [Chloroflexota bacterium]